MWPCRCAKATYSYRNIVARKAFTLSIPGEAHLQQVDYFGLVSGKDVDKFAETGLTPAKSTLVNAPYVQEFPLILECRLAHVFELGLHTQFVGEIVDVKADESVLDSHGLADIKQVKPLVFAPDTRGYYGIGAFLGQAFAAGEPLVRKGP